ncbi:MAG TPA: DUF456 domain-containing protein [Propioniciclava sp.]|uniref:DUF456 domain-containing protein n=1 Tax=Propioniciclava sp. TaxID=2038686 RepID=UPI002B795360|nr:DUF456 domain-containing protein [Propioniciclava sp.]HRL48603.1 DUF456 domain-containing protein [Propioniciclava sp.]HRL80394.1 DUF456 domain-containing protein [Propioniciclava sp.]
MTDTLLALLGIALAIVGVCGVVVPVLPGSASVLAALLVWAWFGPSSWGWVAFGVGAVLLVIGFASQYVLTGKRLKERQIPQRSVVIGLVCGVVGLFVIPFLGLPIGFIAGLWLAEYVRVRDTREATASSWVALKSVGIGMAVELACALTASGILLASILTNWLL